MNDSQHVNSTNATFPLGYPFSIEFVVICSIIFVLIIIASLLGNLTVCVVILSTRSLRRSASACLILSLAVSDLMTTCLVMPFDLEDIISRWIWRHGEIMCNVWITAYLLAVPTSILSLLALSFYRYNTLKNPLDRFKESPLITRRRAILVICILWVYSTLFSLAPVLGWKTYPSRVVNGICFFNLTLTYTVVSSVINFLLPVLAACLINCKMYRLALKVSRNQPSQPEMSRNQSSQLKASRNQLSQPKMPRSQSSLLKVLRNQSSQLKVSHNQTSQPKVSRNQSSLLKVSCNKLSKPKVSRNQPLHQGEQYGESQPSVQNNLSAEPENKEGPKPEELCLSSPTTQRSCVELNRFQNKTTPVSRLEQKRNARAAKTTFLIVFSFVFCWLPFTLLAMVNSLCIAHACDNMIPYEALTFLLIMGYLNSAINPILYSFRSPEFKNALKEMVRKIKKRHFPRRETWMKSRRAWGIDAKSLPDVHVLCTDNLAVTLKSCNANIELKETTPEVVQGRPSSSKETKF